MIEGAFSVKGLLVTGYLKAKEEALWLELLANGEPVAITLADLPRPEGLGFILPLPPVLLEEGCTLTVRKANSNDYLAEPVLLPAKITQEEAKSRDKQSPLEGELFQDRGLAISGWAINSQNPTSAVHIVAKENGKILTRTEAKGRSFRPKVSDGHAFAFLLPETLADGQKHTIDIEDNAGHPHPQSPLEVCLRLENLGQWLAKTGNLSSQEKEFLCQILKRLEIHNPGMMLAQDTWQKAFPPTRCQIKEKCRLSVILGDPESQGIERAKAKTCRTFLSKVQGVDVTVVDEAGDYVLLLQKGEKLQPQGLALMLLALKESGCALVYADGIDCQKPDQLRLKPAFDREYFAGYDYLGPLLVRAELLTRVSAGQNLDYPSLRTKLVFAAEDNSGICHVPEVVSCELPPQAGDRRQKAIHEAFQGIDSRIEVIPGPKDDLLRVKYPLESAKAPLVSIIIPTRDHAELLKLCLDTLKTSSWPRREILIVDNDSREEEALALLRKADQEEGVRVLPYPGIFNYSAINNFAASQAQGEILCFLNNDTEILEPDWLSEMLALLLAPGRKVGCVGAKLLWPNGLVQHGGVVVGPRQLACHIGNLWLDEEDGYMYTNQLVREVSCVTAACMLTPKDLFTRLGGFDSQRYPVAFNDVDYCLRVREENYRILWTPYARLRHHESASRGRDLDSMNKARSLREMNYFRARWGNYDDPFYNPNLPLSTVTEPYFGLALPPRNRRYR
ncbi:MAG: glycosyltransferase family 2 protein [Desulfovibrio sp.]|nr:glycosyltransferase family 2 protein [Desulfovibrio sp.]